MTGYAPVPTMSQGNSGVEESVYGKKGKKTKKGGRVKAYAMQNAKAQSQ